ncbi:MAG: hypothetical protein EAZ97_01030, partial [Bacteroidetes bacterium]
MFYYFTVFLFVFLSFANFAKCEDVLLITEANKKQTYAIENYLYLLADPSEKFNIQDVLQKDFVKIKSENEWLLADGDVHWLRLTVQSELEESWLVHLHGSFVELYTPSYTGFSITKTGYLMPLMERHFEDDFGQHIYLPLKIGKGERKTFYFRISSKDFPALMPETIVEPQISTSHHAVNDIHKRLFPHIFYVCVILGLCLYHIIVYFSSKDHN